MDGVMKFYFILSNPGFGQEPTLLGAAHTSFPACSQANWLAEATTLEAIREYEKYNGPIRWFTCEKCFAEFQQSHVRPISCGNCGHDNK